MKSVSLILRIVAIVGAVACVALWFHQKGIIKKATSDMKGVDGVVLLEKSSKVPGILDEKAKLGTDLSATKTKVAELENRVKEVSSNLESERSRNVKTNQDLVKVQTELRQVKIKAEDLAKDIAKKDAIIKTLTTEIASNKGVDESASKIEDLNNRYNNLNSQFVALQAQYAEAKKKADILDIAVIVEEKVIDAQKGTETTIKRIYPPYVAEGDIATVTIVEGRDDLIALNRGKNNGVGEKQLIDLKNKANGELIAQVSIVEVGPDFSIASVNPKLGKPETLENGDMLELVQTVELKSSEDDAAKEGEAPKAEAPAAPAEAAPAPAEEE